MLRVLSRLPTHWVRRIIHGQGLLRNPYTLGVRVIVEDGQGQILLVRHSYLEGWYLPGGGVDGGETVYDAAAREVLEEAGIVANTPPRLLSFYLNGTNRRGRDHVGLFHVVDWSPGERFLQASAEIAEAKFFAADRLPDGASPATKLRLREFRSGSPLVGGYWSPVGAYQE